MRSRTCPKYTELGLACGVCIPYAAFYPYIIIVKLLNKAKNKYRSIVGHIKMLINGLEKPEK